VDPSLVARQSIGMIGYPIQTKCFSRILRHAVTAWPRQRLQPSMCSSSRVDQPCLSCNQTSGIPTQKLIVLDDRAEIANGILLTCGRGGFA
jgi:hypothetical protein